MIYLFIRDGFFYPMDCENDMDAREQARANLGILMVTRAETGETVFDSGEDCPEELRSE